MLVILLFECHHATQVFRHMVVICVEILTLGPSVVFFSLIQLPLCKSLLPAVSGEEAGDSDG